MKPEVCLVHMPYASLTHPSIALGLIKSYVEEKGHLAKVIYANLEYAKKIGLFEYHKIDNSDSEHLIGEWTFSHLAFPDQQAQLVDYFSLFSDIDEERKNYLFSLRDHAAQFMDTLVDKILATGIKVVGCTSTFQQNCASLALLRRLKEADPSIITLMGGANCEGVMGKAISDNFDWVDYVFSGESDAVIGDFLSGLINRNAITWQNLPYGVITNKLPEQLINTCESNSVPRGYIENMEQVGQPNYDDYFKALVDLELDNQIDSGLLVETSRGCWWGAKKHCTFCGLNGTSLAHRSKSPEKVVAEFESLSSRYKNYKFEVVDNIFPMEYMNEVLPKFADKRDYRIFYETKSNLKEHHVKQMADAGIRWVQPGFESLHDDFLKLINKGVTGIQNIATLKWCRKYGVNVIWTILCGAPFEKPEWYEQMADILPLISHLQPPDKYLGLIRYPRFSPYFNDQKKYGLSLKAAPVYKSIYPLSNSELQNIAYFFENKNDENIAKRLMLSQPALELESHRKLQMELTKWVETWEKTIPYVYMIDKGVLSLIIDSREVATKSTHVIETLAKVIIQNCKEPITFERICQRLKNTKPVYTNNEIENMLQQLIENKLILKMEHCYLSLVLEGEVIEVPNDEEIPSGCIISES